jgi:hypothetical protein
MSLSHLTPASHRGLSLPLLVAAPIVLAAGWAIGTGLAHVLRLRVHARRRALRGPLADTRPDRPVTDHDLQREEVVRAMLESDHNRYDELGRPVHVAHGASSQRQQGAAPIDLRNVEE